MPEPSPLTLEITCNEGKAVAKKDTTQARQTTSAALIPEGKESTIPQVTHKPDQRQRDHQKGTEGKATKPTAQESQW